MNAAPSPRQASIRRLYTPQQARVRLFTGDDTYPGDEAPPCIGRSVAGERIEIVGWEYEGALPVLLTRGGAKYVAWASWGGLVQFQAQYLEADFLRQRLTAIEAEVAALNRARARESSSAAQAALFVEITPLDIDACLIRAQLAEDSA